MSGYFRHIGIAFSSLWDGMRVTWGHFAGKKTLNATLQYPRERWPIEERAIGFEEREYNVIRSRLHVDIDDCIGCMQCERACPVDCIKIDTVKLPKELQLGDVEGSTQPSETSHGTQKKLLVSRFDIDMAECCYCNLCAYPCPEECIYMVGGPHMDKHPIDYEFSERNRDSLVYSFATATDAEVAAISEAAGVTDPRVKRREKVSQLHEAAVTPAVQVETAAPAGDGAVTATRPKKKAVIEPTMDTSSLAGIDDRVSRGVAKKAVAKAVREGKTSAEVAEATKAALDAAGKLTPEIETIVAGLAEVAIQKPGDAEPVEAPAPAEAAKTEPKATARPEKPAGEENGFNIAVLNGISDKQARGKAKAVLTKVKREGGTPADAAAQIREALTTLNKLDDEAEAIIAQLEG